MLSHSFKPAVFIYMLKCVVGLSVCYVLYINFPEHQFYWSMISVLLALAPEENDGNRLAYERIKANITGSVIGLVIFLIHPPNLFLLCLGVVLTIAAGVVLKLENATRSALAAVMIVTLYEQRQSSWHIAFERMFCVIAGCIVALVVTLVFSRVINIIRKSKHKKSPPHKRRANQPT